MIFAVINYNETIRKFYKIEFLKIGVEFNSALKELIEKIIYETENEKKPISIETLNKKEIIFSSNNDKSYKDDEISIQYIGEEDPRNEFIIEPYR